MTTTRAHHIDVVNEFARLVRQLSTRCATYQTVALSPGDTREDAELHFAWDVGEQRFVACAAAAAHLRITDLLFGCVG